MVLYRIKKLKGDEGPQMIARTEERVLTDSGKRAESRGCKSLLLTIFQHNIH
jgi:hypothetical protein